jgi:hypothetical protein
VLDAFVFLLLLQAVGLIGVPFAAALFARLFGGGLAFGRPLGSSLITDRAGAAAVFEPQEGSH